MFLTPDSSLKTNDFESRTDGELNPFDGYLSIRFLSKEQPPNIDILNMPRAVNLMVNQFQRGKTQQERDNSIHKLPTIIHMFLKQTLVMQALELSLKKYF